MTFSAPLVLVGLLAIPLVIWWYAGQQRRRERAAAAFVQPALVPSVAPRRPGWRRHAPMLAFAAAIAALIIAAARPQQTVAVPIDSAAIMLANDVSSSMLATDVSPSRLVAAKRAAASFVAGVPGTVRVGQLEFARHPTVLQSPTTDHSQTQVAIAQIRPGGGGTAIGEAIQSALRALTRLPTQQGKRPPSAIVLLSDGTNNAGISALGMARQAAADHIPVYTISLGTPHGTIAIKRGSHTVITPVPVSRQELAEIATASKGHAFTASDTAGLHAIYDHLATELGHKKVKHEITSSFAGAGLVLLLFGSALSLHWFRRLA